MGSVFRFMVLLMLIQSSDASATASKGNPCHQSVKKIFIQTDPHDLPAVNAPRKPVLTTDPNLLKTQDGVFVTLKTPTDPSTWTDFMARVVPDRNTPLGRVALSLEKKSTYLLFDDLGLEKMGGGGYSANSRRFRLFDPDWEVYGSMDVGRVIALRETMMNTRNFQRILMHEGLHNKGKTLRDLGIEFDFNSSFGARDGKTLYSESPLYQKTMHHEEVRAYANNYVFASVVAHHRETLKVIEKQNALLPEAMPKSVKMKKVKLNYESVIDEAARIKHRKEITDMIENHQMNLDYVRAHLNKWRRSFSGGEKANLQFMIRGEGEGIVIQTEKMYMTLHNVRVRNGKYDVAKIFDEVEKMRRKNIEVRNRLAASEELIESCSKKGYFTAEEYLELKNRMGGISQSMRIPSVH